MRLSFLASSFGAESGLCGDSRRHQVLRHPAFAWLGLRPAFAQHTAVEHAALKQWATGRRSLVEIGVAEGVSALALREAMSPEGTLYLIDAFHQSRHPALNTMRRVARRTTEGSNNGRVVWVEKFSFEAVKSWTRLLDLLFVDADHSEPSVWRDWEDWHHFVVPGGVVVFHDARVFQGGWIKGQEGPVKVVNAIFRQRQLAGWRIVDEVNSLVVVQRW